MTDLKKMSDEELDKKLVYNFKYYPGEEKQGTKLLRRLSEGRKAIEEAENLKCCGNCGITYASKCPKHNKLVIMNICCQSWQPDGKTRKERENE
jgi:hypothetical protein